MGCPAESVAFLKPSAILPCPFGTSAKMAASVLRPHRSLRSSSDTLLRSGKRIKHAWCLSELEEAGCIPKKVDSQQHTVVLDLPEELLEAILPYLHTKDLCGLAQACHRLNLLAEAPTRWQALCAERWGPLTDLHFAAAVLAGSWKTLYKSKHETDQKSEQVQNLCPFELQAAIQRVEACCAPAGQTTVVTFCLDGSGSMASEDFKVMTGFVATAMEAIMEAKHDCKVAVVQFSNDVQVEVAPQRMDMQELKKRLEDMSRMNGGTNIALAIKQAGSLLKSEDADAARIVVLLTDGRVDTFQGREAVKMAERLADEQANVSIFALGVGRGVEKTEMDRIIAVCGADKVATRYIALSTLDEAPW